MLEERSRVNTATTCGVADHEAECLCDVTLPDTPTPIRFGLTELWHGEAIARATGAGVPWTGKGIADFGSALLKAYDMWSRREQRGQAYSDEVLRNNVIDLLRSGESMTDVARIVDCDWHHLIRVMTNYSPSAVWGWDEEMWLTVEAIIYDHFRDHGHDALAKMIGDGSWRVVEALADWYGVKVNENGQDRMDAIKARLREGWHPMDVAASMRAYGHKCSNEQAYMIRKRLVTRGELSPVMPARRKV